MYSKLQELIDKNIRITKLYLTTNRIAFFRKGSDEEFLFFKGFNLFSESKLRKNRYINKYFKSGNYDGYICEDIFNEYKDIALKELNGRNIRGF